MKKLIIATLMLLTISGCSSSNSLVENKMICDLYFDIKEKEGTNYIPVKEVYKYCLETVKENNYDYDNLSIQNMLDISFYVAQRYSQTIDYSKLQ